jgi:hypothetical protein
MHIHVHQALDQQIYDLSHLSVWGIECSLDLFLDVKPSRHPRENRLELPTTVWHLL